MGILVIKSILHSCEFVFTRYSLALDRKVSLPSDYSAGMSRPKLSLELFVEWAVL